MTKNEVLLRQNFLNKVALKDEDIELSRNLKVKIISMRIEYGKIRKQFDSDIQEFINNLDIAELKQLQQISERTEEQQLRYQHLLDEVNKDYQVFVQKLLNEEVDIKSKFLTEDEYSELLNVNANNDPEINGIKLSSADFLEILYNLFVE